MNISNDIQMNGLKNMQYVNHLSQESDLISLNRILTDHDHKTSSNSDTPSRSNRMILQRQRSLITNLIKLLTTSDCSTDENEITQCIQKGN